MPKAPKYNKDTNPKYMSPLQWKEYNESKGYLPVKGARPNVHAEYYDPKENYAGIGPDGQPNIKPYISYTGPTQEVSIDPAHKAKNIGPNLTYDANTGKYFNPITGVEVKPIVEQYAKGGLAQKFNAGGGAYNERFSYVNTMNEEGNSAPQENQYKSTTGTNLKNTAAAGLGSYGNNYYNQQQDSQGNSVMKTIGGTGQIGGIVAGAAAIGDQAFAPMKESSEKMNESGDLTDERRARRNANWGLWLAPHKRLDYKGGLTDFSGKKYIKSIEEDAKNKIREQDYIARQERGQLLYGNAQDALANRNAGITGVSNDTYIEPLKNSGVDDNSAGVDAPDPKYAIRKRDKEKVGTFKDGGKIEGKGTAKSDSINATIADGSYIVPAENSGLAERLRKNVLKKPVKKAPVSGGDVKAKLSDGEHLFTPEEVEELTEKGIDLDDLAPDAKTKLRGEMNFAKGGPVDDVKSQIAKKESGNNYTVKNKAGSSAFGKYQFTSGTFKEQYKKVYGKTLSDTEYQKLKSDPKVQEALMDSLVETNTKALEKAGVQPTLENLYAAHHFGAAGAIEMSRNPNSFVPEAIQKHNPQLKGKTNGQAIDWAKKYIAPDPNYVAGNLTQKGTKPAVVEKTPIEAIKKIDTSVADPLNKEVVTMPGLAEQATPTPAKEENGTDVAADVLKSRIVSELPVDNTMGLAQTASDGDPIIQETAANNGSINSNYKPGGNSSRFNASEILNYAIPAVQVGLAGSAIKKLGDRPVATMNQDYLSRIDNANGIAAKLTADAKVGLTGAEQSALNSENAGLVISGRANARNMAGGSLADSYNLERGIINDNSNRSLAQIIADNKIKLAKQANVMNAEGRVDNLVSGKVDMQNRIFDQGLNAWNQDSHSYSDLMAQGLSNAIAAKRYSQEIQSQKDTQRIKNSWSNGI